MAERIPIFFDVSTGRLVAAQKQLDVTRAKTRQLSSSAGFLNKQFKSLGATLLASFGAIAVIAAIGRMIKSIKDLEFQMSKVAAISGATNKQMVQLRNNAIAVGAASKFTATEVGKLQEELARLGFTTSEILKLTDSISALAIVADTQLGPTALAVAKTINAFSLQASEGARVTNVMAESFTKTALDLEKFEAAMRNVGPAAKVAGFTLEETTALLGLLVDNGIEASKAGTDLRRILLNVSISGTTLNEALEELNLSTNKLKTGNELFGARAVVAGNIIASNAEKVRELTQELSDGNREMDEMRRIMEDNLETDLKKLASAWDALIQRGSPLNNVLRDIVNNLRGWVNVLSGAESSTLDLQLQIFELNKQIREVELSERADPFGFKKGNLRELQRQLADVKAELNFNEILEEKETLRITKLIGDAVTRAFESDDIEKFIENLEETEEKEEIIANIRRIQKLDTDELKQAQAEQLAKKEIEDKKQIARLNEIGELMRILRGQEFQITGVGDLRTEDVIDPLDELTEEALKIWGDMEEEMTDETDEEGEKRKELRKEELDQIRAIQEAVFDATAGTIDGIFNLRQSRINDEIGQLDRQKDRQLALAEGTREREQIEISFADKKKELLLKEARANRAQALIDIAIDTARSAVKLFPKTFPPGILSAIAIAFGAAQTALVLAQPLPKFKEGVIDYQGEGSETSDSNIVKISKRESIIKASASKKSTGILEAINSERLNDDMYQNLLENQINIDNQSVVNALLGVDSSIKKLPIHQTYFNQRGVARYIQSENSRVQILRNRFVNG